MKIAALLTGRGNNTLKDKNVLPVLGKPLLYYPAIAAYNAPAVSHYFVSSDDEKILSAASEVGYKKIVRPKELATPDAKHIDAITHALCVMEQEHSFIPDVLVVLLANSATVKSKWIEDAVQTILTNPDVSAVVPVYQEQDHHPFRAKGLDKEGFLSPFFNFDGVEVSTNRQELSPCYFLCHNFWVLNLKRSLYAPGGQKPWMFMGDKVKPIVVEGCFDVHTVEDVKRTEAWLKENL